MTGDTGETEALARQIEAFAPRVYGLLVHLVGKPDVAEDLMQETLLRAFRSLGRYRPEGKLRSWIFRIAVNLARDWIRQRSRQPASFRIEAGDDLAPGLTTAEARPEADLMRSERAAQVTDAMERLHQADREVLLLRYYGDLPFKEIARATGEPIGTVLARAHRALAKLADLLPEEEP